MGKFSNSMEADKYEFEYCEKCMHYPSGCPVMVAHWRYAYELCNEKEHPGKAILDMLIPVDEIGLYNEKCSMFIAAQKETEK